MTAIADNLLVLIQGVIGRLADLCAIGAAKIAALCGETVADSVRANLLCSFHIADDSLPCSTCEPTYQEQDDGDGGDDDDGHSDIACEQARLACLAACSEDGHAPAAVWTFHLLRILCL
jgi:hypothetical protein